MTNTPKLAIAIGYIDDDLVTETVEYMPHIQKIYIFLEAFCSSCSLLMSYNRPWNSIYATEYF